MAKDILKFHAVIWPALLRAADMEYPQRLAIHGFLLMGEKKMSKSLGNVLDPSQVVEQFGVDALRHYCFREVSFGNDGSVSAAGFEERYDAELANEWGNLASRTLAMIERYRDGVVPEAEIDPVLVGGEDGFEGIVPRVEELLDRAELTQRWARSGIACAGSTATSRNRGLGTWRRTSRALATSTGSFTRWRRSSRAGAAAAPLHAGDVGPAPRRARRAGARAGRGRIAGWGTADRADRAAVSEARELSVVDTHAHLGMCEPGGGELVAARARRVCGGSSPSGSTRARTAMRSQPPNGTGRCSRAWAGTRTRPTGSTMPRRTCSRSWRRTSGCARSARRARLLSRGRAARAQRAAFEAQIEVARRVELPLVIHMRDSLDDTFDVLASEADGVTVILHCFSARPSAWPTPSGRVALLVRREPHLPEIGAAPRGGAAGPRRAASGRDRFTVPRSPAGAREAEPARQTSPRRRGGWPRSATCRISGWRRRWKRTPRVCSAGEAAARTAFRRRSEPARRDRARVRGWRRRRRAGGRRGGGGADRTRGCPRAPAARDRGRRAPAPELEPIAREAGNVEIVWSDALRVDLSALDPAPTTVVSNLPYSIATPLILKTLDELDSVATWTLLVQREIAERLRASPGIACTARRACSCSSRRTSRSCAPSTAPCSRRGPRRLRADRASPHRSGGARAGAAARPRGVRAPAQVARALAGARRAGWREAARAALREAGLPEDSRAEALSPQDFVRLASSLQAN